MFSILDCFREMRRNDPVHNCAVYKEIGCSHVDGMLCDMTDCQILIEFKANKNPTPNERE